MDIKFENDIPIPDNKSKYNFLDNMEIGQSFTVNFSTSVQQAMRQAFAVRNMRCCIRKESNNLMRIWRVK
jgi:hypothetical protein